MNGLESVRSITRSVVAISIGWGLCSWNAERQEAAEPTIHEELIVRHLIVVDDEDRPRIVLGLDPEDTQRISRHVGMTFHDTDGSERMGMGILDNGSVGIGLDAPTGVGHPMRDRLSLRVSAEGIPSLMMINNQTEVPARIRVDEDGKGFLEFLDDYDGETNTLRYRSIGLDVDDEGERPIH